MPFRFVLAAALAVVGLPPLAYADAAADLAFERGPLVLHISQPRLDGTALSDADLTHLFDLKDKASLSERLAKITAKRIEIPLLSGEVKAQGRSLRFIWREVTLDDVAAGRAGAMRAAALEQSREDEDGERMETHYANLVGKGVDLLAFARLLSEPDDFGKEGAVKLEDEAFVDSSSVASPAAKLRTGRIRASGVRMRGASLPGAAQSLGFAGSLELDAAEAQDVAVFEGADTAERPFALQIKRISLNNVAGAAAGAAAAEELSLKSGDGGLLTLRHIDMKGLDFGALLDERAWRIEAVRFEDLAADLPKPEGKGRAKFKIDAASGEFANFRGAVATKFALGFDRFTMDLSADAAGAEELLALGYRELTLFARARGAWSEDRQVFDVDQLRFEAKDIGAANFSASFSNIGAAAFSSNPLLSRAALLTAKIMRFETSLEDAVLIDRLLAAEAKSTGENPAKLRTAYARDVKNAIFALLGESDKSRRIGEAAEKFALNPKRLHIKLSAPQGVGALDALKSPSELLEKVDVEAAAE